MASSGQTQRLSFRRDSQGAEQEGRNTLRLCKKKVCSREDDPFWMSLTAEFFLYYFLYCAKYAFSIQHKTATKG